LAESDLVASAYPSRLEIPLDIGGADWSAVLWVPGLEKSESHVDRIAKLTSTLNAEIEPFHVRAGAARLADVDLDEVRVLRETMALESDPVAQAIRRAGTAAWEDDPEFPALVAAAVKALEEPGFTDQAEPYSGALISDLAFMAWSTVGSAEYDRIFALIPPDHGSAALTAATRALRRAADRDYQTALELVHESRATERPSTDKFNSVVMYGPQMLIKQREAPLPADLVRGVPLDEILDVYEVAIRSAEAGESIRTALKAAEGLPEWARSLLTDSPGGASTSEPAA
jgi:hypothetical protein